MRRLRSSFLSSLLTAFAGFATLHTVSAAPPAAGGGSATGAAPANQPRQFSLVDQHGMRVSSGDLRGHWLMVFFGFTQCPEVCPTTLAVLSAALRELGAQANGPQVIFITIDPGHDTPKTLASYLKNFGPRFTGLTGTAAQIAAAEDSFGAYSAPGGNSAGGLDHSSTVYLLDPQGRLVRQFSSQMTAEQIAAQLRKLMHVARPAGNRPNEGD
jgi:protein SCO1/2